MPPWYRARMGMRMGIRTGMRMGILSASRFPQAITSQPPRRQFHPTQPIKISRSSPFSFRLLVCYAVAAYGCKYLYESLVFGPLATALEDTLDEATRKELENSKAEEDGWFIPFPGTTRQISPPPYRASDPEWQEFLKINGDLELNHKIRADLAEGIRHSFSKYFANHPRIRRYWLDISYPLNPPPEYERSGIEITDYYVAWTTMPVDSLTVGRIRRALWPSGFFQSAYAFVKVLFSQNSNYLCTVLGLQGKTQADYEALVNKTLASNIGSRRNPGDPKISPAPSPSPSGAQTQPDIINANSGNGKKMGAIEAQTDKPAFTIGAEWLKPSFDLIEGHMSSAKLAFAKQWKNRLGSILADPPRGSISVSGLVELESDKSILLIDVFAHWDPKTKDFDPLSLYYRPRRFIAKRQTPRVNKTQQN